ncbi:MAG: hypothetical protein HXY20_12245 [Acidobacteria bacterium]|nr:hypothetical protein [Acidobacteriota bacterium]
MIDKDQDGEVRIGNRPLEQGGEADLLPGQGDVRSSRSIVRADSAKASVGRMQKRNSAAVLFMAASLLAHKRAWGRREIAFARV